MPFLILHKLKMMRNLVFLFAALLVIGCKQEKKETAAPTQMENVMVIHDEVMDKMGHLAKLTGQLKAKVDTTEMGMQYEAAMKDLQAANESMMDWMMNFGDRFDSNEILDGATLTAQKQEWLNEEEEEVKALKAQFNSSIEKAETLLKE